MGSWGVRGAKPPCFRPQRPRGVREACPPGLGHGIQRGVWGAYKGGPGAEPPGLQVHGCPTGVRGLAPGFGRLD